ncbi:hypothetical protein KDL45_18180, partial [bacterium]|nr:hypothetical protein [bacterium]
MKVCDSAMGSGSLLAAALRYLTEALFESLYYHGRIAAHGDGGIVRLADGQLTNDVLTESLSVPPDHPDFDDRLRARLKRYVVERCIYGVDLDPLAVGIARIAPALAWDDFDIGKWTYRLQVGNALIGATQAGRSDNAPAQWRPFDWSAAFPDVFGGVDRGFDAVVGNPPYVSFGLRDLRNIDRELADAYRRRYP